MDWNTEISLAKGYISEYNRGYQDGSKETAEKMYNTIIYRILALNFQTNNKDYDKGFFDAQKEILRRIDNVAKEYNIKIKE